MIFYKYEATQNTFILTFDENLTPKQIQMICDPFIGIGADGWINITHYSAVQIYNKDGSEAQMCGNGLRCVCHLLTLLTHHVSHQVILNQNLISLKMLEDENAKVAIPPIHQQSTSYGDRIDLYNHHLVLLYQNLEEFHMDETHLNLIHNEQLNIHGVELISPNHFKMRSYEYGVGYSNSCGSGAIASFYYLFHKGLMQDKATCETKGGTLILQKIQDQYYLAGPVHLIYKGEYYGF